MAYCRAVSIEQLISADKLIQEKSCHGDMMDVSDVFETEALEQENSRKNDWGK